MTNLVLFDMDDTLIATDTSVLWNEFLFENNLISGDMHKERLDFMDDYVAGILDLKKFYRYEVEILKQFALDELVQLRSRFINDKLKVHILEKAYNCVQEHKAHGDYVVIITATIKFLAEAIAEFFNADYLLASEEERVGNQFTGNLVDGPCMRDGKLYHLDNWLAKSNIKPCYTTFYSDSRNDLPLLLRVDKPIIVDPDPVLKTIAFDNQWEVISFRG